MYVFTRVGSDRPGAMKGLEVTYSRRQRWVEAQGDVNNKQDFSTHFARRKSHN